MDLSIVIVSYNACEILRRCLDSIYRETKEISFETIVVDNNSYDRNREMLEEDFPQVIKIYNKENCGFASACNRGMRVAKGDFILLLNGDTEVFERALEKTLKFMREHENIAVTACKLLYPNHELQRSVRPFPSALNTFGEATFLYLLLPKWKLISRNGFEHFDYTSAKPIDWATGAFLMIRRQALEALGFLDEQFFMYSEEMDFCYRAKMSGFQVWFFPEAKVLHHWGGVHAVTRSGILWVFASRILFVQKHFHGVEKFLILTFMYLGMFLRVPVYLFLGAFTGDRRLLQKSYYFGFAIARMWQRRLRYRHHFDGDVVPWTTAL